MINEMNDPNDIIAYIVDSDNLPSRTSKDKLEVKFEGVSGHPYGGYKHIYSYDVINRTKIDKGLTDFTSTVRLWKNKSGDQTASCNCPARKICKHILETIKVHSLAITAGFIKE